MTAPAAGPPTGPETTEDAQALRSLMRADLRAAMKARRPEAVSALRTALAAIDNAEAVETPAAPAEEGSAHVAGARAGVGSAEAARRVLTADDVRALLRAQVAERRTEAEVYEKGGHGEAAARLRHEADTLDTYLTR
ncbi:GatB/YqeY domain-containing protein [Streptomyces sp. WMMC500]|uniref:GatB/YqeY domain-containing protein n=1 Tax=Streptomyces sp. WMMC500 TaxID=3015154 RepID=UPI00248D23CF|nr:GatB/YqeY domain-containing protein [Streptomyces sp. WMMC500]WBB61058.1 GatB/YqeY domain-containing protein [Streptomyces sp. WMMC500]